MDNDNKEKYQPSYDELVNLYNELVQTRAFEETKTRLAFCFEVLKNKEFFPKDYIEAVIKEIMTTLPMTDLSETEK